MFNFQKRIEKEVAKQLAKKEALDKYANDRQKVLDWLNNKEAIQEYFGGIILFRFKCGCSVHWSSHVRYSWEAPKFEPCLNRCKQHNAPFEDFPL